MCDYCAQSYVSLYGASAPPAPVACTCASVVPADPTPSYYFTVTLTNPTYFALSTSSTPIPFNTVLATSADDSFDVASSIFVVPASGVYLFEWMLGLDWQNGRPSGSRTVFTLQVDGLPTASCFEALPATSAGGGYSTVCSFYEGFFNARSRVTLTGLATNLTTAVRVVSNVDPTNFTSFSCRSVSCS